MGIYKTLFLIKKSFTSDFWLLTKVQKQANFFIGYIQDKEGVIGYLIFHDNRLGMNRIHRILGIYKTLFLIKKSFTSDFW
ncbi:MAG: hypothetical protein PHY48_06965, partial [Candidatus Cloacimonetes bacterium]|nr:hypothetical protein [Candidatus Cloacimonadota bacterium]